MRNTTKLLCASLVAFGGGALAAVAQPDIPAAALEHMNRAKALAGDTFMQTTYKLQCGLSGPAMANFADTTVPEPARLFDNFYYVGVKSVGAYALKTSDGIILIDSLNTEKDARDVIEPGLRKLGLDPAQIKYIVISHGHGDHYGGAAYLAQKYGARVVMSEADWNLVGNPPPAAAAMARRFAPPPAKDMVGTDGMELKLGDGSIRMVLTPGHTPGTLSFLIPVTDKGAPHLLAMWGGTGVPRDPAARTEYVASAAKFGVISEEAGADAELSNHPFVDDSLTRMEQQRAAPGGANPFVIGRGAYSRYAAVIEECAKAVATGGPTAS